MPWSRRRFDIRFHDRKLEQEFQKSKYAYQRIMLIITLITGVTISFLGWAINPLNNHSYNSTVMIIMIILVLFAIIFPFLIRKRPDFLENILFFLLLFYPILFLEYTYKSQYLWKGITYFTSGIITELALGIALLSRTSWVKRNIIFITFNVLCCFRYTDINDNKEMRFYPGIQYIANIIALGLAAFFIERQERLVFLDIKNYELSLNSFKNLVENFFPSAVLVIKAGVILFQNDETKKLFPSFDSDNDEGKFDIFKNIIIHSSSYENPKIMSLNSLDIGEEKFRDSHYSLKELLIIIEKNRKKQTQIGLCTYGSFLFPGERKRLDLEIKITNIFWEKKDATLCIISENRIMKNIKALNDQSEYKDRLLATVSHDLRTPLNGIIGMIVITMESIIDITLKKK